jgi:hypothetical protein
VTYTCTVIFVIILAGVEPSPLVLRSFIGLLYQPWMIVGDDCGVINEMNKWHGKPEYSKKACLSAALAAAVPTYDLILARTRAAAVEIRRLIV